MIKLLALENNMPLFITCGHMTRLHTLPCLIVSPPVQMTHRGLVCEDGSLSGRGGCFYWPPLANEAAGRPVLRKGVYK